MSKYLVRFKPLDLFFFGGENKYRPRKDRNKIKFEADYLLRSEKFPQQTTILGALRYLILQENGQIPIQDEQKAKKLVGEHGFRINKNQKHVPNNYGLIEKLSPVYLQWEGNYYMPTPYLFVKDDNEKPQVLEVKYKENSKKSPNDDLLVYKNSLNENGLLVYENYDPKKGFVEKLSMIDKMDDTIDYDCVYAEVEKVGIKKNNEDGTPADDEDAFYKMIAYKFKNKETAFVVEVDLNNSSDGETWKPDTTKKYFIPMGAEKSPFQVTFHEISEEILKPRLPEEFNPPLPFILLTSDTYVEENPADFSVGSTKTFRFLETKVVQNGAYAKFKEHNQANGQDEINRSRRYNLLARGSVLFFVNDKNKNTGQSNIADKYEFTQIGYNQFISIAKK